MSIGRKPRSLPRDLREIAKGQRQQHHWHALNMDKPRWIAYLRRVQHYLETQPKTGDALQDRKTAENAAYHDVC